MGVSHRVCLLHSCLFDVTPGSGAGRRGCDRLRCREEDGLMALFRQVAELAEELAGEAGRLKKRAAIAEAIAAVAGGGPVGRMLGCLRCIWRGRRLRRRMGGS